MPASYSAVVGLLLATCALGHVPAATAAEVKTSKERLSDKASDEQRMDNCGVPPERRGSLPRPSCPQDAISSPGTKPQEQIRGEQRR
jgi:hypothetical protein